MRRLFAFLADRMGYELRRSRPSGSCPYCGLVVFPYGTVLSGDLLVAGIAHIADHANRGDC